MKKLVAFLLALVMCLSLCACGGSADAEYVEQLERRLAELEGRYSELEEENRRIIADSEQVIAEYEQIIAGYEEKLNGGGSENPTEPEPEPEPKEPEYESVEITLDNWQEYFELRVYRLISLNGFGEFDRMVTRYFLATKDGIIPDCRNSDVTMEYVCAYEIKPYVVDIANRTFTYGAVTDSYTSKAKIQTLWDVDIYIPTGNIFESVPGQVTSIYESGLGGDVEVYGDRILEDSSIAAEGTTGVIVSVDVSRVTGTLRFTRQGE